MTSVKPAARWKDFAKERIELTPPTSPRAANRFETEDLVGYIVSVTCSATPIAQRRPKNYIPPPASQVQICIRVFGTKTLPMGVIVFEGDSTAAAWGVSPLICIPSRGIASSVGHEETW